MSQSDHAPAERRKAERRRVTARQIVALVIAVLLVAFVVDNTNTVRVGFVFFHARLALIWVLLGTVVLSVIADRLVLRREARRHRSAFD